MKTHIWDSKHAEYAITKQCVFDELLIEREET